MRSVQPVLAFGVLLASCTGDETVFLHASSTSDAGSSSMSDMGAHPALVSMACVLIVPEARERWPRAPELVLEAIGRWGLPFAIGGSECSLVVAFNSTVRWAKTEARAGRAVIGVNPDAPIVDTDACSTLGEWSERELRFVDVVTHEFGHVLGLPEAPASERDCAMCLHAHCEDVFPTEAELEAAGLSM